MISQKSISRSFIGVFVLIFFTTVSFGQNQGGAVQYEMKDTILARKLYKEVRAQLAEMNFENVKEKIEKSVNIYLNTIGEKNEGYAEALNIYGRYEIVIGRMDSAVSKFDQSLAIAREVSGEESALYSECLIMIGIAQTARGQFDKAIETYNSALDIRRNVFGENNIELSIVYNGLGLVYYYKDNKAKAFENYNKVLELNKEIDNPLQASIVYYLIANTYKEVEDYGNALIYYKKGLEIKLKLNYTENVDMAMLYNKIGDLYLEIGAVDKAMDYQSKAIKILEDNYEKDYHMNGVTYNSIGKCFYKQGKYEEAQKWIAEAVKTTSGKLGDNYVTIADYKRALADCLRASGKGMEAIAFRQEGLNLMEDFYGRMNASEAVPLFLELSKDYRSVNDFENAVKYAKKGFEYTNNKFGNKIQDHEIIGFNETLLQVYALSNLGQSYFLAYEVNGDEEYLKKADTLFETALGKVGTVYNQMFHNLSKVELQENINEMLFFQVAAKKRLFELNPAPEYKEDIFDNMEASRAYLLLQSIKESDASKYGKIPPTLVEEELNLRVELAYEEKKYFEKINGGADEASSELLALSERINNLKRNRKLLIDRFEEEYPDYYKLKYELSTVSLDYVQDSILATGQTLLEYFVGDSSIFIFTVNKGDCHVQEIKKDFPLEEWVKQLQNGLSGYYGKDKSEWTDNLYKATLKDYMTAAEQLHEKLIAPVKKQLAKEVILIPDGVLGYVPFEALLKGRPKRVSDFETFPFLFNDHRFSYCYSATLLREMKEKQHEKKPEKSLVAFAPFYTGSYAQLDSSFALTFNTLANGQDTLLFDNVVTRKDFNQLPGSGEEVKTASELWGGDYFLNTDATEERFNEVAGDYRIVHLSTHGIADPRVGDYSYLAFAEQKDSIENEFLYVRDLYNTQLNADLIVLSACETATGELQRGEGIISLARAFAYAGAKSILTTLWVVDDSSTKELTKEFYLHLKKGKKKDTALYLAKKKHLKLADNTHRHPFFWAAMIPVGDMSTIE